MYKGCEEFRHLLIKHLHGEGGGGGVMAHTKSSSPAAVSRYFRLEVCARACVCVCVCSRSVVCACVLDPHFFRQYKLRRRYLLNKTFHYITVFMSVRFQCVSVIMLLLFELLSTADGSVCRPSDS